MSEDLDRLRVSEKAPVVNDVRKRIVALYKAWGKEAEAGKWESKPSGS